MVARGAGPADALGGAVRCDGTCGKGKTAR